MKNVLTLFLLFKITLLFSTDACDPAIAYTALSATSTTICQNSPVIINFTGLPASQTFRAKYQIGAAVNTSADFTSNASGAGSFTTVNFPNAGTIQFTLDSLLRVVGGNVTCGTRFTTNNTISITVRASLPTTFSSAITAASTTICSGTSASITIPGLASFNGQNITATYTINGTNAQTTSSISVSGGQAQFNTISLTSASSIIAISSIQYATAPACGANVTGANASITINVRPPLTLTGTVASNICGGSGSSITLSGLPVNLGSNTLTASYSINTTPATTATSGSFSVNSSGVGNFTTIPLTSGGQITITSIQYSSAPACPFTPSSGNSATFTLKPQQTLSGVSVASSTICQGGTASVTLNGLIHVPGQQLVVQYNVPGQNGLTATVSTSGAVQGGVGTASFTTADINQSGAGQITIVNIGYSVAPACTSPNFASNNTASITVRATPTLTGISINPVSICQGQTTSISLSGLIPNQSFTVGVVVPPSSTISNTGTSSGGGVIQFTSPALNQSGNISAATIAYSNAPTCSVNIPAGTIQTPITVRPTISLSSGSISALSTCQNSTSVVTINNLPPNQTLTVTYIIGGGAPVTSPAFTTNGSGSGQFTTSSITSSGSLTLTVQSIQYNTAPVCPLSASSNNTATILVRPTITLSTVSATSVCSTQTSTVTLAGLLPSQTNPQLVVTYSIQGVAQTPVTLSSNSSGVATFTTPPINASSTQTLQINSIAYATAPLCPATFSAPQGQASIAITPGTFINSLSPASICQGLTSFGFSITDQPNPVNLTITWASPVPPGLANPTIVNNFTGSIVTITGLNSTAATGNYVISSIGISPTGIGCAGTFTPVAPNNVGLVIKPNPVITSTTNNTQLSYCPSLSASTLAGFNVTLNGVAYNQATHGALTGNWNTGGVDIGFGTSNSLSNNSAPFTVPSTSFTTLPNNGSSSNLAVLNLTVTVNGCSATNSSTVFTLKPRPTLTSVSGFATTLNICSGNQTPANQCFNSSVAGSTFSFTSSNSTIFSGSPGSALPNGCFPQLEVVNAGVNNASSTITVTAERDQCISNSIPFTINARPKPNLAVTPQIASGTIFCSGQNIEGAINTNLASSNTETNLQFTWSLVPGNPSAGLSISTASGSTPGVNSNEITNVSAANIGVTLEVNVTNPNAPNCSTGNVNLANYTIRPRPNITTVGLDPLTTSNPLPLSRICNGEEVSFSFAGSPNATDASIAWTQTNAAVDIGLGANTSGSLLFNETFTFTGNNNSTITRVGNFTATPRLTGCPTGFQNGISRNYTIEVLPGPTIIARLSLPSETIELPNQPNVTRSQCSGVALGSINLELAVGSPGSNDSIRTRITYPPTITLLNANNGQNIPNNTIIIEPDIPNIIAQNSSTTPQNVLFTIELPGITGQVCEGNRVITFSIRPTPVITATAPTSPIKICAGQPTTIDFSSDLGTLGSTIFYKWRQISTNVNIGLGTGSNIEGDGPLFIETPLSNQEERVPRVALFQVTAELAGNPQTEVPSCFSANFPFEVRSFKRPDQPTASGGTSITNICSGSLNIPVNINESPLPFASAYEYEWSSTGSASSAFTLSGLNGHFNFGSAGSGNIQITRNDPETGCSSTPLELPFTVNQTDASELSSTCIFTAPLDNGMIAMNTEVDSYQWGFFNCDGFSPSPPFLPNSGFQAFFPENFLSSLDTRTYWVELSKNQCRSRVFYQAGCFLNIPGASVNPACPQIVSVNEVQVSDAFHLYPNPTNGVFNLEFLNIKPGDVSVTITDVLGRIIQQTNYFVTEQNQVFTADLSNASSGVYLVAIIDSKGSLYSTRVMVSTNK